MCVCVCVLISFFSCLWEQSPPKGVMECLLFTLHCPVSWKERVANFPLLNVNVPRCLTLKVSPPTFASLPSCLISPKRRSACLNSLWYRWQFLVSWFLLLGCAHIQPQTTRQHVFLHPKTYKLHGVLHFLLSPYVTYLKNIWELYSFKTRTTVVVWRERMKYTVRELFIFFTRAVFTTKGRWNEVLYWL